jgi:hypothetical protein
MPSRNGKKNRDEKHASALIHFDAPPGKSKNLIQRVVRACPF